MQRLLLATTNPGKARELRALLAPLPLELLTPANLRLHLAVQETGQDYLANARLKALAFARASGLWSLADDTGLEVEALSGAPGLRSARLAGPGASDADRRRELLRRLQGRPRPWKALFRAVVVLASPQGETTWAEGVCAGEILPAPRGQHGFGYDPLFLVEGTGRTMAELSLEEKNRLSHRARAVQALWPALQRLAQEAGQPPRGAASPANND